MSRNGDGQNRKRGAIWIRSFLAIAPLLALLIIRNLPPEFPNAASLHQSSINDVLKHSQRPRFDFDGLQWSAPASRFLPFPPADESEPPVPSAQLRTALQSKGFHYNRPPPAG
jgi:hypothetical protein